MWVSLPMLDFSFFPVLCQRRGRSSGSFFSIGKSKLKFLLRNLKPQLTILNHFLKIPELPVDQTHYTENNKSSSSTKLHSKAVVWGESKETNKQTKMTGGTDVGQTGKRSSEIKWYISRSKNTGKLSHPLPAPLSDTTLWMRLLIPS